MITDPVAAIAKAALWLATSPKSQRPSPLIPHLKIKFGLTSEEAIAAIQEARLIQARAL